MKQLILLIAYLSFFLIDFQTSAQVAGQIPLDPKLIPQFTDALPHFAGIRVDASGGNLVIRYDSTKQVTVSTGTVLANGTVGITPGAGVGNYWAYAVSNDGVNFTPPYWPAFTIEAYRGTPVNVTYENHLDGQHYSDVNLKADQTLHWADPLNEMGSMEPYLGPIPVVPHLHGGEVPSESDGGPDAWFTPGYLQTGPSWGVGQTDQYYYYPNSQEEATLWFHDHSLGVTRLNVYAGLAGFYFLRGPDEEAAKLPGWSGDDLVREIAPPGKTGPFNPNPYLPEIEIVFQDRMFDNMGELYFPNLPTNPTIHPFWTPEFIGDVITVNGKTWPYLSVAPRKYRFRLLNGSNARFYELWLQDLVTKVSGPAIIQIGTDGGLLDAPVTIDAAAGGKLLLAPGERADIIIDFSQSLSGQVWTMKNSANTPFPKGGPPNGSTVGRIMQFIVNGEMVSATDGSAGTDKSLLPQSLRSTPLVKLTDFAGNANVTPVLTRQLTLNEVMDLGGPKEVLVNNTKWGGTITEIPEEGTTELWQIINLTADAHPIHLHLVQFQLIGRQKFNLSKYAKVYDASFAAGVFTPAVGPPLDYMTGNPLALGGNPSVTPYLQGMLKPANLNEQGWKDTYVVYPGEVTTFIIRYAPTDKPLGTPSSELVFDFDPSLGPGYVWHCHIIDHEDNEMMRPYLVTGNPARYAFAFKSAQESNINSTKNILLQNMNDIIPETKFDFSLDQNFPNPVLTESEIHFQLPERMPVKLTLYNQAGQEIKVLLDTEAPAGNNTVILNRNGIKSGIYYYRMQAGNHVSTKKLIME